MLRGASLAAAIATGTGPAPAVEFHHTLFVVIDPNGSSPVAVDAPFGGGAKTPNLWNATHGDAQHNWLQGALEGSTARFRFAFDHHVTRTEPGRRRTRGRR